MKHNGKFIRSIYLIIFLVIFGFLPSSSFLRADSSFYFEEPLQRQIFVGEITELEATYSNNRSTINFRKGFYGRGVSFHVDPKTEGKYQILPNPCKMSGTGWGGTTSSRSCSGYFFATSPGRYEVTATYLDFVGNTGTSQNKIILNVVDSNNTTPRLLGMTIPMGNVNQNQASLKLKVQTYPIASGITINFSSDIQGFLPNTSCVTDQNGACFIQNIPTHVLGRFKITFSASGYGNNTINIDVVNSVYKLDPLSCPEPTQLVDGSCECVAPNKVENNQCIAVSEYKFLAPLGEEQGSSFNPAEKNALSKYLNIMIKIIIGIAAVLSVIMIVMGGIQYMTSELISSKEEGKKRITNAILGLLIALGSYLILFTINPNLLDIEPELKTTELILLPPGEDGLGVVSESTTQQMVTLKLKNGSTVPVVACSATDKVRVNAFGTSFTIQKNLLPSIRRIDAKWRQLNPAYKIPMTVQDKGAMGGYVCRNARGQGKLSWHAYGLAIDINPVSNPQGKKLITDMPAAFVKLWTDEGWGWGGNWSSFKDAMHFSKGRNEGGNMTGE